MPHPCDAFVFIARMETREPNSHAHFKKSIASAVIAVTPVVIAGA
jgi:hypothetical protein